jgi:hypothetical protein
LDGFLKNLLTQSMAAKDHKDNFACNPYLRCAYRRAGNVAGEINAFAIFGG